MQWLPASANCRTHMKCLKHGISPRYALGWPPAGKGVCVNFLPIDLLPSRPGARFKATRFMISIANLRR